jgi:hypothetical protein
MLLESRSRTLKVCPQMVQTLTSQASDAPLEAQLPPLRSGPRRSAGLKGSIGACFTKAAHRSVPASRGAIDQPGQPHAVRPGPSLWCATAVQTRRNENWTLPLGLGEHSSADSVSVARRCRGRAHQLLFDG